MDVLAKKKKPCIMYFFYLCQAVSRLHPPHPVSLSPRCLFTTQRRCFNDASGLSIQSESDPLHLHELSGNKSLQVTVTTPATWNGTHATALAFHRVTGTEIRTKALSAQSDFVFGWIPARAVCLHTPPKKALSLMTDLSAVCEMAGYNQLDFVGVKIDSPSLILFCFFWVNN